MLEIERDGRGISVDVVIPCYQYGRFLRECVTSVLTQGIQNLRVLIIDNASTDDSVEVAQQLACEDRRVELVARRRNLGPHASFNEGIDWAKSHYFMILCADDLLVPRCLTRAVSIMEQHAAVGFAYGRPVWLRPQDPMPLFSSEAEDAQWRIVSSRDLLAQFCRDGVNHVPSPSTVLVRTVVQKTAGYYRPELPHTDDFEMWLRLANLGPAAQTDGRQAILRLHPSSRNTLACRVYTCERPPALPYHDEAAFESFFAHDAGLIPEAERLHRLAKRSLAERAYWAAVAHLCRGQPGISWDLFRFAVSRRPTTAILPPVGYLVRRHDTIDRIIEVAVEMVRRPRASIEPALPIGPS